MIDKVTDKPGSYSEYSCESHNSCIALGITQRRSLITSFQPPRSAGFPYTYILAYIDKIVNNVMPSTAKRKRLNHHTLQL